MNNNKAKASSESPLGAILHVAMGYWYVFVLSLLLSLAAGYFIGNSLTEEYTAQTKILIKQSGSESDHDAGILTDIGVDVGVNSLDDELEVMKSAKLINRVIEKLNLTMTYRTRPLLRDVNVYDRTPIYVESIGENLASQLHFNIRVIDQEHFAYQQVSDVSHPVLDRLYRFFNLGLSDVPEQVGTFGQMVTIDGYRFRVTLSDYGKLAQPVEPILVTYTSAYHTLEVIRASLRVYRMAKNSGSVFLGYTDSNAKRAADILTTLTAIYNNLSIEEQNVKVQNTERFIDNRISLIYKDLGSIDTRLEHIKRYNNVPDITSASSNAYERKVQYEDELKSIDLQLTFLESLLTSLKKGSRKVSSPTPLPSHRMLTDLGLEEQVRAYNTLVLKLLELLETSGNRNPVLISYKKDLQAANLALMNTTVNIKESIETQRETLVSESRQADYRMNSMMVNEKIVNDVMREQGIKEQLYLYLLNKRETNAIQMAVVDANATVIEPTSVIPYPIFPDIPFIMVISMIVGLVLPGVGILGITVLDNKVRTKDYLQENSSLPVLGMIIRKPKAIREQNFVVSESGSDIINESFRIVRSEMDVVTSMLGLQKNTCTIYQVVSANESEGKTFIATNLAFTYAHTNKKVLLIDGDLRRKGVSKLFGNKREEGLANYLMGLQKDYKGVIKKSQQSSHLDYMTVGLTAANPVSLLMSERFEQMINELRKEYDYIIIDSTPYFVIADAKIINKIVDQTIWVMRAGVTRKELLGEVNTISYNKRMKNLSLLVTDVDMTNKRNTYKYSYTYDYSYSYNQ